MKYTLRYSTVENLCVRTGPGTGYPIVGLLKKGDSVLAGNRAGKWRQVSYCGQNCYVFGRYLSADAPQAEWPPEEPLLERSAVTEANSAAGLTLKLKRNVFHEGDILLEPFFYQQRAGGILF